MENLEEIKIRSITGGNLHRHSFVFHILWNGKYLQYTKNHLNSNTINLRLVYKQLLLTHFHSAQNLKNASIFGVPISDCIFPKFFGEKIDNYKFWGHFEKVFYEIRQRNRFTGRDRWTLGID